jgi:hypothetical protein
MFFDEALLWQPNEPMQRRETSSNTNTPPSWSWIGWEGELMIHQWQSHWSHLHLVMNPSKSRAIGNRMLQVVPMVKWYFGDNLDQKVSVNPSGHAYIDHLNDPSLPLPPKWSRWYRDLPEGQNFEYSFEGQPVSNACWYPIPAFHNEFPRLISARYLFCRTSRGYLKCQHPNDLGYLAAIQEIQGVSVILEDKNHDRVGFLILNLGMETFVEPSASTEFELVVISAGSFPSHDIDHFQRTGSDPLFGVGWGRFESFVAGNSHLVVEFYYVLWIGWENGIAHRKGLGRVLKKAWDREKRDEIDLILG